MLAPVPTIDDGLSPQSAVAHDAAIAAQILEELRALPEPSLYADAADHGELVGATSPGYSASAVATGPSVDMSIAYGGNFSPEPTPTSGEIQRVEGADMAALMRELSSLNSFGEDEPVAQVISRPVTPSAAPTRKKKSFFGK